jgi:hypothetical protein
MDSSISKQRKILKNTDIYGTTVGDFLITYFLKTGVSVLTVSSKKVKTREKNLFFVGILKATEESGSVNKWYVSPDPETYHNVTDPEHCRTYGAKRHLPYQHCAGL